MTGMTDGTTTPVADTSNEALLARAWKVHEDAEKLITQHSLRLIGQELKEMLAEVAPRAGTPTGRVRLNWEESAAWEVELTQDGQVDWFDVDDLSEDYISDTLGDLTPGIWETTPRTNLEDYAEEGTLKIDRTFGMLGSVVFTIERMLAGPVAP